MIYIIFFLLGLIIGSFINCLVYRLNIAETILGRSLCPKCKKQIEWYDNIPLVSFILLKAKCRNCKKKISWQYPMVEFLTGIIFVVISFLFLDISNTIPDNISFQNWITTFFYLFIFSIFWIIFIYDLKFMEIPMIVLWIGVLVSIIYFLYVDWNSFPFSKSILESSLHSGMLAGFLASAFFWILVAVSRETWMGMGDVYLAFLIGLITGWPLVFLALLLSFSSGAIIGIIMIALQKKGMKSQIPFAPFLVFGVFMSVVLYKLVPDLVFSLYLF